jgi:uncharacterized spore protein YtfJ
MEEKMTDEEPKVETAPEQPGAANFSLDTIQATMDKFLSTASVNAVFARPVRQGDTVIINCSEVVVGLGFGIGEGSGDGSQGEGKGSGSGGGGGGQTFARPVAAIIASPDGVTIKPILDLTKIGLAALTTFGFMAVTLARLRRGRN